MSKAHYIMPAGPSTDSKAVRLGASATSGGNLGSTENGKLVKLTVTDTYDLCAVGDLIDGRITSLEPATSAGWTIGGINEEDTMYALADGLQATPGTGTLAVGDYVVCGTVTAKGTRLPSYPKVCKSTIQPGTTPATLAEAGQQVAMTLHPWRVVSLGTVGTGAVGTTIVIERVG